MPSTPAPTLHSPFESSRNSGIHSKRSKVRENTSDNRPCRYCILELSCKRPACLPTRDQFHALRSLQASAGTRHTITTQWPPSFTHSTNCDWSILIRWNTKEPFINRANTPMYAVETLVLQFTDLGPRRQHCREWVEWLPRTQHSNHIYRSLDAKPRRTGQGGGPRWPWSAHCPFVRDVPCCGNDVKLQKKNLKT